VTLAIDFINVFKVTNLAIQRKYDDNNERHPPGRVLDDLFEHLSECPRENTSYVEYRSATRFSTLRVVSFRVLESVSFEHGKINAGYKFTKRGQQQTCRFEK